MPRTPVRDQWWNPYKTLRRAIIIGAVLAAAGITGILYTAAGHAGGQYALEGTFLLMNAASWPAMALDRHRHRNQPAPAREPAETRQDLQDMVGQGRKIEAVKRYRQLHPGASLKEAKHAIDQL